MHFLTNILDCGSPSIPHGTATTNSGTTVGSYALVNCDPGYTSSGSSSYYITCQSNGTWSNDTTCEKGSGNIIYVDDIIAVELL